MKPFLALPPLLLAMGCAHAAEIEHLAHQETPPFNCDVRVDFASACCGINRPAREGVERAVRGHAGVKRAAQWMWGREGEVTLCVATTSPAAADRLFADLAAQRYAPANSAITTVIRGDRRVVLDRS